MSQIVRRYCWEDFKEAPIKGVYRDKEKEAVRHSKEKLKVFEKLLNAKAIVVSNKGHISAEDGINELTEIYDKAFQEANLTMEQQIEYHQFYQYFSFVNILILFDNQCYVQRNKYFRLDAEEFANRVNSEKIIINNVGTIQLNFLLLN